MAPAEKPTIPMRSGSIFHSAARRRIRVKAARASSSCGARPATICCGSGGEAGRGRAVLENISFIERSNPGMSAGVWFRRYLRTNAATPRSASARATFQPSFSMDRVLKTAARSHDDGGTAGLGRVGQERRDRRHRDVASELAAVLGVPRFSSLRVGERRRCQSRSHSADRGWRSASSCRSPAQRPAPRMSRPRPEWPLGTRSAVRK